MGRFASTLFLLLLQAAAYCGAPAQQQQGDEVVRVAHEDLLRFIHPDADFAVGMKFGKLVPIFEAGFNQASAARNGAAPFLKAAPVLAAIREIDHVLVSGKGEKDVAILLTGQFQRGRLLELIQSIGANNGQAMPQKMRHVILADTGGVPFGILMASSGSMQAALVRLQAKEGPAIGNWVSQQARELGTNSDFWFAATPKANGKTATPMDGIQKVFVAATFTKELSLTGELVADSPEQVRQLVAKLDQAKQQLQAANPATREMLSSLIFEQSGNSLRFSAKGLRMKGSGPVNAMNAELIQGLSALLKPNQAWGGSTVSEDKLAAVKKGMKAEEVIALVGKPVSIAAIRGLETPRETWTYRLASGKSVTLRLDDGIVTSEPLY